MLYALLLDLVNTLITSARVFYLRLYLRKAIVGRTLLRRYSESGSAFQRFPSQNDSLIITRQSGRILEEEHRRNTRGAVVITSNGFAVGNFHGGCSLVLIRPYG